MGVSLPRHHIRVSHPQRPVHHRRGVSGYAALRQVQALRAGHHHPLHRHRGGAVRRQRALEQFFRPTGRTAGDRGDSPCGDLPAHRLALRRGHRVGYPAGQAGAGDPQAL